MSFWEELKRRNVYKVSAAYAIVAWLIAQGVAIIFPAQHLPGWTVTFVIALLIIGFPIALLLAWAYEVTPEGIKRTKEVPLAESIRHITSKKLNYILVGVIVLAVAYIVFDKFYLDRRAIKQEVVTTETPQVPAVSETVKAKKTIAVLPFENLSSDPEQTYFVDGLSEEILNSLCQIPDLNVIARTSSFSFKGTNKTIQEIAAVLGVDNILEGSVRKAGNALRITAQLVRATDGVQLWSDTYDRELKDIFAVQEDIARAVADELKVTLGIGKSLRPLGGTDNVEAYEHYLVAKGQMWTSTDIALMNKILESLDAALVLDPEFALAWAYRALTHTAIAIHGPANRAAAEQDAAIHSAQKAIEFEPKLGDAYYVMGFAKTLKGDWINAELAFRKALELPSETYSGLESYLAVHYLSVGYFKRAHEILKEIRQKDPLNRGARSTYLLSLAYLGDAQGAEKEYERGRTLFGDQWPLGDLWITCIRSFFGDVVSRDEIIYSDLIFDAAKEHLESPKEGLAELHRLYTNDAQLNSNDYLNISLWAAYFGDHEFTMEAMEKALSLNAADFMFAWVPLMREVRQTLRFKKFVREIGLVDYWNKFGWPDICHQLDNGDFVCD